jgi:hypothetical protein
MASEGGVDPEIHAERLRIERMQEKLACELQGLGS